MKEKKNEQTNEKEKICLKIVIVQIIIEKIL